MLCEKCRIREANVRFMEIINGVKNEHNLCAQCAAEMNFGPYTTLLEGEFNLGKLLSGLMGLPAAAEGEKIKKLQDSDSHTGKQPKMRPVAVCEPEVMDDGSLEFTEEEKIRQLERALKEAIRNENFEEAAVLRDRLRSMREDRSC